MLKFSFRTTKAILVEAGSSARIGDLVSDLGAASALIVTDKGIQASGLLNAAIASLKAKNIRVELFTEVVADPPEDVVLKAVKAAQDGGAECVIGLGGGSSMDVAKLVALLAMGKEKLDDIYGVSLAKGPRLPLYWCRRPPEQAPRSRRYRSSPRARARRRVWSRRYCFPITPCSTPT